MRSIKLDDLVTIVGGGTPDRSNPEYWNGKIPWVTVKDFKDIEINSAQEHITRIGLLSSASNLIKAGSIIIPTRMALGKAAVNTVDIAINQDLKALVIKDSKNLDQRYLLRLLLSKSNYFEQRGKGATVKGITLDVLKELEIFLPPIKEQKQIAAVLDKADNLRRKRYQTMQLTDDFLRATFFELFGNPVTNQKGWPTGTIRDLVESVNYGTSEKANDSEGEFPILRMMNITYDGRWNFSSLKYITLTEKEKEKYLAKAGDILFNRTNSKELVGKTAVFELDMPMAIAGYLIRVRTNQRANPYYISAYLNSAHGKQTLSSICKSIVGMANINAQELQDIKIQIPPKELQDRFAEIVTSVRTMEKKMNSSVTVINSLFSTLSQQLLK